MVGIRCSIKAAFLLLVFAAFVGATGAQSKEVRPSSTGLVPTQRAWPFGEPLYRHQNVTERPDPPIGTIPFNSTAYEERQADYRRRRSVEAFKTIGLVQLVVAALQLVSIISKLRLPAYRPHLSFLAIAILLGNGTQLLNLCRPWLGSGILRLWTSSLEGFLEMFLMKLTLYSQILVLAVILSLVQRQGRILSKPALTSPSPVKLRGWKTKIDWILVFITVTLHILANWRSSLMQWERPGRDEASRRNFALSMEKIAMIYTASDRLTEFLTLWTLVSLLSLYSNIRKARQQDMVMRRFMLAVLPVVVFSILFEVFKRTCWTWILDYMLRGGPADVSLVILFGARRTIENACRFLIPLGLIYAMPSPDIDLTQGGYIGAVEYALPRSEK